MALVELPSILWMGFVSPTPQAVDIFATDLDASSRQRVGFITRVPRTGILDHVTIGVAGVSTAQDLKISFQNVANGLPDGTIDQFRVVPSGSVVAATLVKTGLMTSDGTDTGTKRSVTRGDLIAVVIQWNATAGSSVQFGNAAGYGPEIGHSYVCTHNGSAWTKFGGAACARLLFHYNDGALETTGYYYAMPDNTGTVTWNGATPDEVGMRFVLPWTAKLRLAGIWGAGDVNAICKLYDSLDNLVATRTLDFLEQNLTIYPTWFAFNDLELTAGELYRITIQSPSAASTSINYWTVNADMLTQFAGNGQWYMTERTDNGAWTDRNDRMPVMILGFIAIDPETAL